MARDYKISITVTGRDLASNALGKISGSLKRMGEVAGGVLLARGIENIGRNILNIGGSAFDAAGKLQGMTVSLETLAARERVAAGQAETILEALSSIGNVADDLFKQLRRVALVSPFEFDTVQQTFRMQMAFDQSADMATRMTEAILDTASALGQTDDATQRMAYNLAQINMIGQITAMDLRQLRLTGLDLAQVFKSELGMSVEQVNEALKEGKLTMRDVSEAFIDYAKTNFAGAAERLSRTFQGLKASFADFVFFSGSDVATPTLTRVTDYLNEILDIGRELLETGYFKEAGEEIGANFERILKALQSLIGQNPEEVIRRIVDGFVTLTDKVADLVEWFVALEPETRKNILAFGGLALAAGPAFSVLGSGIGIVGGLIGTLGRLAPLAAGLPVFMANLGTAFGLMNAGVGVFEVASMGAAGLTAALAPLAIGLGAVAVAAGNMNREIAKGAEETSGQWSDYINHLVNEQLSATAIADRYIAKQKEILDLMNVGGLEGYAAKIAFGQRPEQFLGNATAIAQAIMKTAGSYEEYRQQMERVRETTLEVLRTGALTTDQFLYLSAQLYDTEGAFAIFSQAEYRTARMTEYLDSTLVSAQIDERLMTEALGESTRGLEGNTTALAANEEAWRRSQEAADVYLQSLEDMENQAKVTFDELNTGLDGVIQNFLEKLEFLELGGAEVQQAFAAIEGWFLDQKITPEQAKEFTAALYPEIEAIKVKMGEITASEAAKNVSETLGVSLADARAILDDIIARGKFDFTSYINIIYNEINKPAGWSGGGGGRGGTAEERRATGGPGYPVPTWVGELGPEIIVPPPGSYILNHQDAMRAVSGGGSRVVIEAGAIQVYSASADPAEVAQEVVTELTKVTGQRVEAGSQYATG